MSSKSLKAWGVVLMVAAFFLGTIIIFSNTRGLSDSSRGAGYVVLFASIVACLVTTAIFAVGLIFWLTGNNQEKATLKKDLLISGIIITVVSVIVRFTDTPVFDIIKSIFEKTAGEDYVYTNPVYRVIASISSLFYFASVLFILMGVILLIIGLIKKDNKKIA